MTGISISRNLCKTEYIAQKSSRIPQQCAVLVVLCTKNFFTSIYFNTFKEAATPTSITCQYRNMIIHLLEPALTDPCAFLSTGLPEYSASVINKNTSLQIKSLRKHGHVPRLQLLAYRHQTLPYTASGMAYYSLIDRKTQRP